MAQKIQNMMLEKRMKIKTNKITVKQKKRHNEKRSNRHSSPNVFPTNLIKLKTELLGM